MKISFKDVVYINIPYNSRIMMFSRKIDQCEF